MILRLLVVVLFLAQFCVRADEKYTAPPPEFYQSNLETRALAIAPGDVLNVRFYYNPELNKTVKVQPDGKISLDLFQGIAVTGQTPEQIQKRLVDLYSQEFTHPEITVDLVSQANSSVFVTGEVLQPGAKELHGKMTVAMVLALSQVSQKTAGSKSVFLVRSAPDGKFHAYKLDASLPAGTDRDIELAPGDVLFVPRKAIVKADDFVEQYIRQLLPLQSNGSVGVIYTPGTGYLNSTTSH